MDFSPIDVFKRVLKTKEITIEKCRQIAVIAGANPQTFFSIDNKTSAVIKNKKQIFDNLKNQTSDVHTFIPATVRNLCNSKNLGGRNDNILQLDSGPFLEAKARKAAREAKARKAARKAKEIKAREERKELVGQGKEKTYILDELTIGPGQEVTVGPGQEMIIDSGNKLGLEEKLDMVLEREKELHKEYQKTPTKTTRALLASLRTQRVKLQKEIDNYEEAAAENTEAENTEAENTEAENTEAENTKAENTKAENTEAENTKAENTKAENTKAEKGWSTVTTVTITVAMIFVMYFANKMYRSNRIAKLVRKDSNQIHDKTHARGLHNYGRYDGCLHNDSNLHKIFKMSDKNNESIDKLRYRLLVEWNSSVFGKHNLHSEHLVRKDGSLRDTAEEIAHAISEHTGWLGFISRGIDYGINLFSSRRKSSQTYLKKRSSKRSNRKVLPSQKRKKTRSKKNYHHYTKI